MLKKDKHTVDAARHLEQSYGVSETTILTVDEYQNKIDNPPDWIKSDNNYNTIKVELYNQPEKAMIKTLHDLIQESLMNIQIHYKEDKNHFYVLPTTNSFPTFDNTNIYKY